MTKRLLIVAASGLVLAMVLLSSAWVIGGKDAMTRINRDGGWTMMWDDDHHQTGGVTRTLPLDPAQKLVIDAPVSLHFTHGGSAQLTVHGPEAMLSALRWEGGRLWLDRQPTFRHYTLDVTVTGPRMPDLAFQGAGRAELEGIDQPALTVDMSGAGAIEARGRVERLTVNSSGAGKIDLEELEAHDATVSSSGVGLIDLSATGKVDASLSGAGRIALHRKPAQLTSSVSGIGVIDQEY